MVRVRRGDVRRGDVLDFLLFLPKEANKKVFH